MAIIFTKMKIIRLKKAYFFSCSVAWRIILYVHNNTYSKENRMVKKICGKYGMFRIVVLPRKKYKINEIIMPNTIRIISNKRVVGMIFDDPISLFNKLKYIASVMLRKYNAFMNRENVRQVAYIPI
jgi:hypothetical protein